MNTFLSSLAVILSTLALICSGFAAAFKNVPISS